MLTASVVLFAIAAILGVLVALPIFQKKETNKNIAYAHGAAAAAGLVLLILVAVETPANYPQASLILFVIAALGGFVLFYNDLKKKAGPIYLVAIHALAAVAAFVLLLVFVFA